VNCLLIAFVAFTSAWFFSDESPNSNLPWALRNPRLAVLRVIKLLFGAAIASQNATQEYSSVCLLVLIIIDLVSLYLHIISTSYLSKVVQTFDISFASCTLVFGTYALLVIVLFLKT